MSEPSASPRQRELLSYIRASGVGQVSELARMFGVSASTVRRDLGELHERGMVERHHGGAAPVSDEVLTTWLLRRSVLPEEKRRIGAAAAAMVSDNSTVLILGGTTTEQMLPHLASKRELTVITNSLVIANRLAQSSAVEVVVLGGVLRRSEMALLGELTVSALSELGVDQAFSGAYGIDPKYGVTRTNLNELNTDRSLLSSSAQLVVLADHGKFGRRGHASLAPVSGIGTLVTDDAADPSALAAFRAAGVSVVVAPR